VLDLSTLIAESQLVAGSVALVVVLVLIVILGASPGG
jgi:hypothetical protein